MSEFEFDFEQDMRDLLISSQKFIFTVDIEHKKVK